MKKFTPLVLLLLLSGCAASSQYHGDSCQGNTPPVAVIEVTQP